MYQLHPIKGYRSYAKDPFSGRGCRQEIPVKYILLFLRVSKIKIDSVGVSVAPTPATSYNIVQWNMY